MGVVGAGNVARAAGARAVFADGLSHGCAHIGMLAHAQIVVGTPDHDVARPVRSMPRGVREVARLALQVRENSVTAFRFDLGGGCLEDRFVIHRSPVTRRRPTAPH